MFLRTGESSARTTPFLRLGRAARGRRVLIIVQNLPVPLDRRVWMECRALVAAGFTVSVICPKGPDDPTFEVLEKVRIHKYSPPRATAGVASFIAEAITCWIKTVALTCVVFVRTGFDVIQTCNPPDTYFALAWPLKLFGIKFVYDQHDLCPELYLARFGRDRGLALRCLKLLERATYAAADHVISTNESYRTVALTRGRKAPSAVTVVRSAPDTDRMRRQEPVPSLSRGRTHLVCWLGIIGPQDGVDLLVRAFRTLVFERNRRDIHLAILGFGDALESVQEMVSLWCLDPWVSFTGRADETMIAEYLSTADLAVSPDPKGPFNDVSTMNKVLEYMAFELPIVAFDLKETRFSAQDSARYATPNEVSGLADAIAELLDSPDDRRCMGLLGRKRMEEQLAWRYQAPRYVEVYERLLDVTECPGPVVHIDAVTIGDTDWLNDTVALSLTTASAPARREGRA